jgi:hypothetical protein
VFHLLLHPRAICVCAWLNLKRLGPKSEQSGDFVTEVIFTAFPSEGDGSPKFWTVTDGNRYLNERCSQLEQALGTVDALAQRGELPDVAIAAGELKITPLTNTVPKEATSLMRQRH